MESDAMVMSLIYICCAIGIVVSVYSLYLESRLAKNPFYKPMCDINDKISCTAALQSDYSHFLGLSNALLGFGYYGIMFVLSMIHVLYIAWVMSAVALIFSCYLAYILAFKIKIFCPLCVTLYIVNGLLFIILYQVI